MWKVKMYREEDSQCTYNVAFWGVLATVAVVEKR